MNSIVEHLAKHNFTIIGHRGAAGLSPENTLDSFATALQWRCPMLELDVHLSREPGRQSELIVVHDNKLDRTTNGHGLVTEVSTKYVRSLDAGNGQTVPFLAEVLALLTEHDANTGIQTALNIELKGKQTAQPVATLLASSARPSNVPILISSFDLEELRSFRLLDIETPIALLYHRSAEGWRECAAELGATAVNLSVRLVTNTLVQEIRQAGYSVFVYTVNSAQQAAKLRKKGVSGVFTDYPDRLMTWLDNDC